LQSQCTVDCRLGPHIALLLSWFSEDLDRRRMLILERLKPLCDGLPKFHVTTDVAAHHTPLAVVCPLFLDLPRLWASVAVIVRLHSPPHRYKLTMLACLIFKIQRSN